MRHQHGEGVREADPLLARADARPRCCSERTQTLVLILVITGGLFMDQNLLAPHLTDVAREFNFTDAERDTKVGGELSFSLFLVGAPAALVMGYLGDHYNRKYLYVTIVLLGDVSDFLVVFVDEFWQLFVLRACMGIAVASVPLAMSMLADMYAADERPVVTALIGVATGVGMGIGQGMSSIVGDIWGWRTPFLVVAVLLAAACMAFLLLAHEPERGCKERDAAAEASRLGDGQGQGNGEKEQEANPWSTKAWSHEGEGLESGSLLKGFRDVFGRPSNLLIYLQGIPGCVPGSMIGVFLNDYLFIDKHAPSKLAAVVVCGGWGVGTLVGQLAGGWYGQELLRGPAHKRHHMCYLMSLTTVLAIVPLVLVVALPFRYWLAGVALIGGCLSGVTGPLVRAVLLNCNTPDTRSRVFAVFSLTDDLGKGLGPPLIGAAVTALGRAWAFSLAPGMWLLCGGLLALVALTMAKDEEAVASEMAARRSRLTEPA